MIKKCSILGILFCLLLTVGFAAEKMDAWNSFAPIHVEGQNKYKAFFLTEEVYEQARSGLGDLRIVDGQGEFVPFYMENGVNTLRKNKIIYSSQMIQTFKINNDSYTDYRIVPINKNTDVSGHNLAFELPVGDFLKYLAIYGGNDGESWEYIGKEYVFRAGDRWKNEVSVGNKRKYTYYRIAILDNPENITLKKLTLNNSYSDNHWNGYVKTDQVKFDLSVDKNQSVLTIENKQKLVIKQIILEVEGNFQRNYKVYGDDKQGGWLKTGELYNLQFENVKIAGTNIDVSSSPISSKNIIIKIDNRDDRPLNIKNVKIEYYVDKIVFPEMGSGTYRLYFGNDKTTKPNYEIELQKQYIGEEQQDLCSLETVKTQSKVVGAVDSLTMKYIFNGAMVSVSILLVILLLSRLKKKI